MRFARWSLVVLMWVSACARVHPVEPRQAELDAALTTRSQLQYYFLQLGAVPRPPMPADIAETAGTPPYEGAAWKPGAWIWTQGQWQWQAGAWTDPDVFTASGEPDTSWGDGYDDDGYWVDDNITNPPPLGYGSRLRDHRTHGANTSGWTSASHPDGIVRDHRSHKNTSGWTSTSHPDGTVHDHRSSDSSSSSSSNSSDSKKSDDKDTKDYGGTRFGRPGR